MRITFLCSSLEPGWDGVGDYARLLAQELVRSGHVCQLVALHDRWLSSIRETSEDASTPAALRLPADLAWDERLALAEAFIAHFDPEWVSLQFVPYGFHDRGLCFGFGKRLARLTPARRLHIMFHELWIGDAARAPWKERLVGRVQRALILSLLRRTRPERVTTSNPVYRAMLQEGGCESQLSPLFGNIPIVRKPESAWLDEALAPVFQFAASQNRESVWVFVFFGTLHPIWEPEPLFSIIRRAAARAGKAVIMLALGRLGGGEALWRRLVQEYGSAFQFLTLGEQSAARISEALQYADAGIAASPWELIGKSGSAASMTEHGLPVIVTRHEPASAAEGPQGRFFACDDSLEEKLMRGLPRTAPADRLPVVAAEFTRLLDRPATAFDPSTAELLASEAETLPL